MKNRMVPLQDVLEILESIERMAEAHESAWQFHFGDAARMAQNGFAAVAAECNEARLTLANAKDE